MEVVNATVLLAQWTALKLETLSISFYTVYYETFSEEQNQTAVTLRSVPNDTTSFLLDVRDLTPGLQHQFRVTASVEREGEVIEGEAREYAIVFGKLVSCILDNMVAIGDCLQQIRLSSSSRLDRWNTVCLGP